MLLSEHLLQIIAVPPFKKIHDYLELTVIKDARTDGQNNLQKGALRLRNTTGKRMSRGMRSSASVTDKVTM